MELLNGFVLVPVLLEYGYAEETFNFFQGKSVLETSHSFEMTLQRKTSISRRQCAILCHHIPTCLAAFFEGESTFCRLYSNINGMTTGGEGDCSMVKKEFGICEFMLFICIYC